MTSAVLGPRHLQQLLPQGNEIHTDFQEGVACSLGPLKTVPSTEPLGLDQG